jgi:hypothetical protein
MMSEYLARLPAKLGLGVWGVGRNTRWQGVGTLFARKTAARKIVGKTWGILLECALEAEIVPNLKLQNLADNHQF